MNVDAGHLELNVFTKDKALNLWVEGEISINLLYVYITYFESYEVKKDRKTYSCVRAVLNTGKVFYPKMTFNDFKTLYYSFVISLENANPQIIGEN